MSEINDIKCVKEVKSGNTESLATLCKKYIDDVYNFFYNKVADHNEADIEDLTQKVFLRCLKGIKNFDENSTFRTWLFGIAKNVFREYCRKKHRKIRLKKTKELIEIKEISLDEPVITIKGDRMPRDIESSTLTPEEEFTKNEEQRELLNAIKQLTEEQQEVIILRFGLDHKVGPLSIKGTARYLKKSEGSVKMAFIRAIEGLQEILSSCQFTI